ncbi:MAG TPA: hypothetical protein VII61_04040 [Ktedonobacteraceae bacterium]
MERHVLLAAARVKKLGRGQMYRAHRTGVVNAARTVGAIHLGRTMGAIHLARPMGAIHLACTVGAIHLARTVGVSPVNAFFQADVSWVTNYDVVK